MDATDAGTRRMSAAAVSVLAFGVYLMALGTGLLLAPNVMLGLFGRPPTTDAWLRVVGLVGMVLGAYYAAAARAGVTPFFGWTVKGRLFGAAVMAILVATGTAPGFVLLIAAGDVAGAAWTAIASRRAG